MKQIEKLFSYLLSAMAMLLLFSPVTNAESVAAPREETEAARFKRLIRSNSASLRIDFYMSPNERRIKGISSVVLVTPGTLLESGSIRLFWDGASPCSADSQVDKKTLLKLVDFLFEKKFLDKAGFTCSEALEHPKEAAPFKRFKGPEKGEVRIVCQTGEWWVYANLDPDDRQIAGLYRECAKQLPQKPAAQMNQLAENTDKLSVPDGSEAFNRLMDVLVFELFNR